jgi:hypothetical protein
VRTVELGGLVRTVAHNTGVSPAHTRAIIDAFSLEPEGYAHAPLHLWDQKRAYRPLHRFLLRVDVAGHPHVVFSREMAMECLMFFIQDLRFQKIPEPWRRPLVSEAIARISNDVGNWWEQTVAEQLEAHAGIVGVRSRTSIGGTSDAHIVVPEGVGELDFLGYSEADNALLVLECKCVRPQSEPKGQRRDRSRFVDQTKSYADQLRRKLAWVSANLVPLHRALVAEGLAPSDSKPGRARGAIVTYAPSIASEFLADIVCNTLWEILDWISATGSFPEPGEIAETFR